MRIAYTPEQERLRQELRAYFAGLMTPEFRAALSGGDEVLGDGEAYLQVVRQLGKDGWLALGWPAEHGGRGGTMLDQLIFTDEAAIARVPVPFLTINTVGPTIMRYGTPEQKAFYLPKIAAGEIHFSIGYSEPEPGTDLAALRTTAVRTVAGVMTSATYYSSVRVPASSLVGEENRGWPLITNQLNHERVALTSAAPVRSALRAVRDWASATTLADGRRVIDAEWARVNLARVHAKAEFLKLMNWKIASGGA